MIECGEAGAADGRVGGRDVGREAECRLTICRVGYTDEGVGAGFWVGVGCLRD